MEKGITISGPEGVALYRLVALKSALKLQKVGIGISARARKATTICREDYGLKGKNPDAFIPQVEALIEKAKETLPEGAIR